MFQNLIDKSMKKSPWLFHINAGSCNGCDIELVSVLTPRYDAERFGFRLTGTPRQADIVVVSGPITMQSRDRLIRTLAQVPEPKCVVSLGSCPRSGNVFKGSFAIDGPLEKYTHVDVSIGGCTPKPEAIVAGLAKASAILEEKRKAMRKGGIEAVRRMENEAEQHRTAQPDQNIAAAVTEEKAAKTSAPVVPLSADNTVKEAK